MLIGICGKSGSGKTTLANQIIKYYKGNAIHCDVDKIGHKAHTDPISKEKIINHFGNEILTNGNIDRKKLGKIVFNSKEEMQKLTEVTWTYMQQEIDKIIHDNKDKVIILDWILLPNSKYLKQCKYSILLDVPYEVRKKRAMLRDSITEEAFDLRDKASPIYDENQFNLILKNNTNKEFERLAKLL